MLGSPRLNVVGNGISAGVSRRWMPSEQLRHGFYLPRARKGNWENGSQKKSHYEVLGLNRSATQDEIKAAFRQLVHKYHPDVNKQPEAEEAFKRVLNAYEVLSNKGTRYAYDSSCSQAPRSESSSSNAAQSFVSYAAYYGSQHQVHTYERIYGRRRRKFEPKWIRQARVPETNTDDRVDFEGSSSFSSSTRRNWFQEWEAVQSKVLVATWCLGWVWQVAGTRLALAALVLGMACCNNFSLLYKLALAVSCAVGGVKGVTMAIFVLVTSWVCGVSRDAAVLMFVLGLWIRGSVAVQFPGVVILLMAHKLSELRLARS